MLNAVAKSSGFNVRAIRNKNKKKNNNKKTLSSVLVVKDGDKQEGVVL